MKKTTYLVFPILISLLSGFGTADAQRPSVCLQETFVKNAGREPVFGVMRDPPKGSNPSVWLGVNPDALVVDSSGHLYVADQLNYRILKFDRSGKLLLRWSLQGSKAKATRDFTPWIPALAVDVKDNLYVINDGYGRVEIYRENGAFLRSIEYSKDEIFKFNDKKFGKGYMPEFVRVDAEGKVYLFDRFQGGGGVYSATGELLVRDVQFDPRTGRGTKNYDETKAVGYSGYYYFLSNAVDIFNRAGEKVVSCPLEKINPASISSGNDYVYTTDRHGNVYILDHYNMDIIKLSPWK